MGVFEYMSFNPIDIMDEMFVFNAIDALGYGLIKRPGLNKLKVFPRVEDILKSFRHTPLSLLKVIIMTDCPYTSGRDTGIPFVVDEDNYPQLNDEMDYTERNHRQLLGDIVAKDLHDISKYGDGITNDVIYNWINQGVLLIRASPTTDEIAGPQGHFSYWGEYSIALLNAINMFDDTIPVISIGELSNRVCASSFVSSNTLYVPDLYAETYDTSLFTPFTGANKFLSKSGKQTIDW